MSTGNFWGIIYFSRKSRFFSINFEYWVILFWRVCHSSMLRVQMHFRKKFFFDYIFSHFRTMSANFSGVWKKNSAGCHEGNLHVRKKDFRLKSFLKKIFFSIAFVHWENHFCPLKKNWQCQNWNLRVHGNSLMKTFVWKILVFLSFVDILR